MANTEMSSSLRATHADLSTLHARFIQHAVDDPELHRSWDWKAADLPPWMLRYAYPLQAWPLFLDAQKEEELAAATVAVSDLVRAIPERVFDNDPERMAARIGFPDPSLLGFLLDPPTGLASSLARCDLIDTGAAWKCVELNLGANLGGWQLRFWAVPCLQRPPVREFLQRHGVAARFRDPLRDLFRHTCEDIQTKGVSDREVNLCLMISSEEYPFAAKAADALGALYNEVLEHLGGGLHGCLFMVSDDTPPTVRNRCLWHDGSRIHGLVEYTGGETPRGVYRCFMAGTVRLYNGPLAALLGNKQSLALLSTLGHTDRFDRRERELIEAHVPWSREVGPGQPESTHYRGEKVKLLPFAVEHREELVLKPSSGRRGEGVQVGVYTDAERWRRRLDVAADEGGWVLQEYSPSRPYLFQDGEGGYAPHDVIWGTFCFGSSYGGGFLRMMPRQRGDGVINSARGAVEGLYYAV